MGTAGKRTRASSVATEHAGGAASPHKKSRKHLPSPKSIASESPRCIAHEGKSDSGGDGAAARNLLEELLSTFPELQGRTTGSEEHQIKGNVVAEELYSSVSKAVDDAFMVATAGAKKARPYQADAVAKLVSLLHLDQKSRQLRPFNYLVQHATGTGKSLTISALTLVLLQLQSDCTLPQTPDLASGSAPLFSAVIVLTDRLQLDRQLGDTLENFLHPNGWTLCRCSNGSDLSQALQTSGRDGPLAILSTLQKFAVIAKNNRGGPGEAGAAPFRSLLSRGRVAILADEAHRSHGKSTSMTINEILGGQDGQPAGVTYFGFSATPSRAALRLFGVRRHGPTGTEYAPAHCYSMQQAIADGHVMNPLQDYTCLRPDLALDQKGGPRVAVSLSQLRKLAAGTGSVAAVGARVQSCARVLRFKAKFILQHLAQFEAQHTTAGQHKEDEEDAEEQFRPRAMVVCRSRADVLAYTRELRRGALKRGQDTTVYGAFSGELEAQGGDAGEEEEGGEQVTEASLNAGSADLGSAKVLVVCNKLETGFDEPRLAVMYIDRPLSDARCVQVLSRCNRRCAGKRTTAVVDFVNDAQAVRTAFAEFWAECSWGSSEAAAEARAMEELDGCVSRLLGLLQAAGADAGSGGGVEGAGASASVSARLADIGALTPAQLAERVGSSWDSVERVLHDLELYQELCKRLNSHKFELPPTFAAALQRELAEARAAEASGKGSEGAGDDSEQVLKRVGVGSMTETHKGTITVAARGSGFGRGGIVKWDVHGGTGGGVEGGRGATLRQLAQQSALQRGADFKETCQHARQQRKWIEKMLEAEEAKQRGGDLVRREGDRAGLMLALQRLALLPMTKEVLVETGVGVVVKGLRKHGDAGVREMAKSVVVQWKALLRPTYPLTLPVQVLSHRHGGHLADSEGRELVVIKLRDALLSENQQQQPTSYPMPTEDQEQPTSAHATGSNSPESGAAKRPDSAEGSAESMSKGSASESAVEEASAVAKEVERAVAVNSIRLGRVGGSSQEKGGGGASGVGWYKQKVRQLLFNLRDRANGTLRQRVLRRELAAEELVTADAMALANESLAAEKKKLKEEAARAVALEVKHSGVLPNTAEYACPECAGRRCHVQFGMKGGWISSEKEGTKEVVCCDCLVTFDG